MTSADNVSERQSGERADTRVRVGVVPEQGQLQGGEDTGRLAASPRQPLVFRNDYARLDPPPLGEWTPTLSVSVVIPAHGQPEKLALVLASLAAQSYPAHLMEVVVVDDGSPVPLALPEVRPEHTRLITSDPGGWGSAHAVNTGVADSSGQVVLRLDADMLVYREHVESQMRWHHVVDYAVVMGHKMFVDFDPAAMTPEHVRDEVAAGRAELLFDLEGADPHWVERFIDRHDRLRSAHHEAFKVFVGATGSLHRSLFDAAGGLDPGMILGGDSEFGHRVAQRGAFFVPDTETSSWHLGRSQMQEKRDAGTRYRKPYVANRVPDFHLRRKQPERQWEVPLVDVVLDAADRTLEEIDTTARALLSGTTPDLRLWMVGPWGALDEERRSPLEEEILDLRLAHETFRGDPRVRFVESEPSTDPRVPYRLYLEAGAEPYPKALAEMVHACDTRAVGLLCAPMPGALTAQEGMLRLERTAAFARARHLDPEVTGRDLDRLVEEVHGIHWMPATDLVLATDDEEARLESPAAARQEEADPQDVALLQAELEQTRARADRMRRRAERAERKLRWFTPGLVRRALRRMVR
ncbi:MULTISPECIES: glycosyltransferase family 2 protein [unclassified Nocardiopsis]|uniref:glycosyltransferase n=1 Tax=unclassified Nocardiopsis TaxID=2649073 RepID=UPI00066BC814|nr:MULTISPECIES: glycosyltransferase family 2 protein [unclassified Nocardiopsis]MBQ1082914.1 glycosyltransferase [Nocardiopsis sp. B62]